MEYKARVKDPLGLQRPDGDKVLLLNAQCAAATLHVPATFFTASAILPDRHL
jgi:hypothetical protein